MLVDTPLDKLVATYKTECNKDTKDPGTASCDELDYMRNCIFAAHGLAFEKKKWKTAFAGKGWYTVVPDFKAKMLSAPERATVTDLNDRAKACKANSKISAEDFKRVNAWFAALPKVPDGMPKDVFVDFEKSTPAKLVEFVVGDIDGEKKMKSYALEKFKNGAIVDYATGEDLPDVLVKIAKGDKVRIVRVDIDAGTVGTEDNPITEGTNVWFAYDAKDTLIAVAGAHYLWD